VNAEAITYALLNVAAVTALASTRIYPVQAPQGCTFPAVVFAPVSNMRLGRIDAYAETHPTRARVQVDLLAATPTSLALLRTAVVVSMQFQRGAVAGATLHAVLPGPEGPISFDSDRDVYHQAVDFVLMFSA
jgi:hypothetical protein